MTCRDHVIFGGGRHGRVNNSAHFSTSRDVARHLRIGFSGWGGVNPPPFPGSVRVLVVNGDPSDMEVEVVFPEVCGAFYKVSKGTRQSDK